MPDAPTPDEVAEIRARHRPEQFGLTGDEICDGCYRHGALVRWPCDAALALAALDAATTKRDAATMIAAELMAQRNEAIDERDEARADLARVSAARDTLADRVEAAEVRRKAAAWDALYGMVDVTRSLGRAQLVTTALMAELMRRQREEADHA